MNVQEVAPPGFGHTKGDKEKGVKKGGTAAAFDRARKEGRFKGSKSDMFAIMWSQKNKGDKPHYKPGTDKKYKKYQEEETSMPNVEKKDKGAINKRFKGLFKKDIKGTVQGVNEGKLSHLAQASVLSASDDPKDQDRAREIKTRFDYESLKRQIGSKKKHDKPAIKEASFKDYMAQAQAARDREKKRREDRKKSDAQYSDTRKHGVRFYDKKGKGRMVRGKKVYD